MGEILKRTFGDEWLLAYKVERNHEQFIAFRRDLFTGKRWSNYGDGVFAFGFYVTLAMASTDKPTPMGNNVVIPDGCYLGGTKEMTETFKRSIITTRKYIKMLVDRGDVAVCRIDGKISVTVIRSLVSEKTWNQVKTGKAFMMDPNGRQINVLDTFNK